MRFYAFFNPYYGLILLSEFIRFFLLISLTSEPLKIWFCQFARHSSHFFSLSAIPPKIMVCSRAKSNWVISKSDAPSSDKWTTQTLHIYWNGYLQRCNLVQLFMCIQKVQTILRFTPFNRILVQAGSVFWGEKSGLRPTHGHPSRVFGHSSVSQVQKFSLEALFLYVAMVCHDPYVTKSLNLSGSCLST